MNENFRLTRHLSLWEEKNSQIRRTIFSCVILGLLLMNNVLRPYSQDLGERQRIQDEILGFEAEKARIEHTMSMLNDLHTQLEAAKSIIVEKPWMQKKNDLVDTLAQM